MTGGTLISALIIELVALLAFTAILVRQYAAPKTSWVYLTSVFASWYLGFCGIFLLPFDLAYSYFHGPPHSSLDGWKAVYWMTFLLTWVILPLLMEYQASGYFHWRRRLFDSFRVNLKFYLAGAVVFVVVLVILLATKNITASGVPNLVLSLANTYGLLLIILLLGYGLVELPKKLWRMADSGKELRRIPYFAVELEGQYLDAKGELRDVEEEARSLAGRLPSSESLSEEKQYLKQCIDTMLAECDALIQHDMVSAPADRSSSTFRHHRASQSTSNPTTDSEPTLREVADVYKKLKNTKAIYLKSSWRWRRLVEKFTYYEAVYAQRNSYTSRPGILTRNALSEQVDQPDPPTSTAIKESVWLTNADHGSWWTRTRNRFIHAWHAKYSWLVYRILSILSVLGSLVIIWCQGVIPLSGPVSVNLSPLGQAVDNADGDFGKHVMALIPLLYICACVYFSLFRIKLFRSVELINERQSDPYSLMFNASIACRLQFSLAFNYLNVLNIPFATGFSKSVGSRMALTFINDYLPLILLLLCVATAVNAYERILRLLHVDQPLSPQFSNPEHQAIVEEGVHLLQRAQQRLRIDHTTMRIGFFNFSFISPDMQHATV